MMMTNERLGLTTQDFAEIIAAIARHSEIERAIVFGSRAKGMHQRGSDVDLALQGQSITRRTVRQVNTQLNERYSLPYFFDVVHYDTLRTEELIAHIDRVGVVIYAERQL